MNVDVLLCDADGNLFPSEGPAFAASAEVTNRLMADLDIERRFTAAELRGEALGRNFRSTAVHLAARHGVPLDPLELEPYVVEERRAVTAQLRRVLEPDPEVSEPLQALARRARLAVVSSSALARLDACLRATDLAELFPPKVRFSAEDSLPAPASKPDPAVYAFAGEALGASPAGALAIEDAVAGVQSAVGAGFSVVGNLAFVPLAERGQRADALLDAGATTVVRSWRELSKLLGVSSQAAA
jgi:beta-phosphoglucomutase-like phosphatase (HAD superfamily)